MRREALLSVFLAAATVGCSTEGTPPPPPAPNQKGVLTGTVTYRERMALPSNSLVKVRLWDALEPPSVATVGETSFVAQGQVPLPFELFFDPALIQASHTYGARASITVEGVVWFESETPVPVLTNGAPTVGVELLVKRVPQTP